MFIAVPSCVLPIGPEFQDPPPVPNYQPYFAGFDPAYPEQTYQILSVPSQLEIDLNDPNPGDKLAVRWIANYPPFVPNATNVIADYKPMALPADSTNLRVFSPDLTCIKFPLAAEKNLVVIVSDRDFAPQTQLASLAAQSLIDGAHRYNYKNDGDPDPLEKKPYTQTFVMVGWRIAGCQ
jgi:hypothetical protein